MVGTAHASCLVGSGVMEGPVRDGWHCLHFMPCGFGLTEGPVWGGWHSPHTVPCWFWWTDGAVQGGWHGTDGGSDSGWTELPGLHSLQVRAGERSYIGWSRLAALRAAWVSDDGRSDLARSGLPIMPDTAPDRTRPAAKPNLTWHGAQVVPSALNRTIHLPETTRHGALAMPSTANRTICMLEP